jgi:hypothetical protein
MVRKLRDHVFRLTIKLHGRGRPAAVRYKERIVARLLEPVFKPGACV